MGSSELQITIPLQSLRAHSSFVAECREARRRRLIAREPHQVRRRLRRVARHDDAAVGRRDAEGEAAGPAGVRPHDAQRVEAAALELRRERLGLLRRVVRLHEVGVGARPVGRRLGLQPQQGEVVAARHAERVCARLRRVQVAAVVDGGVAAVGRRVAVDGAGRLDVGEADARRAARGGQGLAALQQRPVERLVVLALEDAEVHGLRQALVAARHVGQRRRERGGHHGPRGVERRRAAARAAAATGAGVAETVGAAEAGGADAGLAEVRRQVAFFVARAVVDAAAARVGGAGVHAVGERAVHVRCHVWRGVALAAGATSQYGS